MGLAMAKKGICKARLLQRVSVTSQVAISRRVHGYKLALRDRQATRGKREEEGGLMPMAWGCHRCRVGNYESWKEEGK